MMCRGAIGLYNSSRLGSSGHPKKDTIADIAPLSQIKIISYKEKGEWVLESKYNIGKKKQGMSRADK